MAVDWIKMRVDLQTHPKVVRIMSALNADKCPQDVRDRSDRLRVIGGLHAVWSLFDAHTEDGKLDGYTFEIMDATLGWPGFSAAMASVGWLEQDGETLVAPEFEEHNGKTAKRRAMESQRKSEARKVSAFDADKNRTREEKRREEVNLKTKGSASTTPLESTPSGRVCARLRQAGIQGVNPSNPKLLTLLSTGIPEAEFVDLAAEPQARGKGMAWILAAVEGRRRDAAAASLPPAQQEPKRKCCYRDCEKDVAGVVSGRPWCQEHREYAMDAENFRREPA